MISPPCRLGQLQENNKYIAVFYNILNIHCTIGLLQSITKTKKSKIFIRNLHTRSVILYKLLRMCARYKSSLALAANWIFAILSGLSGIIYRKRIRH